MYCSLDITILLVFVGLSLGESILWTEAGYWRLNVCFFWFPLLFVFINIAVRKRRSTSASSCGTGRTQLSEITELPKIPEASVASVSGGTRGSKWLVVEEEEGMESEDPKNLEVSPYRNYSQVMGVNELYHTGVPLLLCAATLLETDKNSPSGDDIISCLGYAWHVPIF